MMKVDKFAIVNYKMLAYTAQNFGCRKLWRIGIQNILGREKIVGLVPLYKR